MNSRLGIEICPDVVRAVRLDGFLRPRIRAAEAPWDSHDLSGAVAAVRESLGPAHRVTVALDLHFLHAKQVRLPPLPFEDRRRMLGLEPERFFPIQDRRVVFSIRPEDNLAFVASETFVTECVTALEPLGALDAVEPSPVSLARAVARGEVDAMVVLVPEPEQTVAVLELGGGLLRRLRRVPASAPEVNAAMSENGSVPSVVYALASTAEALAALTAQLPVSNVRALPVVPGLSPRHMPAYGAALAAGWHLDPALMSAELAERIRRRRRGELWGAAVVALAALLFAAVSLDASRERTLQRLDRAIATLQQRADAVRGLEERALALAGETRRVQRMERERTDPLQLLLALTGRLPPDAYVQSIRGTGGEWQIDGSARSAARIVPLLSADPRFREVRFLTATSRVPSGGEVRETFSLALRFVPAP